MSGLAPCGRDDQPLLEVRIMGGKRVEVAVDKYGKPLNQAVICQDRTFNLNSIMVGALRFYVRKFCKISWDICSPMDKQRRHTTKKEFKVTGKSRCWSCYAMLRNSKI